MQARMNFHPGLCFLLTVREGWSRFEGTAGLRCWKAVACSGPGGFGG